MPTPAHTPTAHPARRRPLLTAVAATVLALLLTACGSGGGSGSAGGGSAGNATLKWAASYFPANWDPVVSGSGAQFRELALVYASLTKTDEKGNAVPDLAESWDYNDKGDEVTFHVRPGQKFTDGEPVNAEAVKSAIERAKTQKDSALFGDLTSIKQVTTDGDLDVVVHLSQVDYQIPLLFGERVLQIASPKAASDPKKLAQAPVGAGPFTVTQLVPGTKVLLKKNQGYWDAKNIHIDKVELISAPDTATVVSGLQTGVYNFADLDPSQAAAAKKAGLDVFVQPGFNASNISLNINKAPFDNPKVVEALKYAIDRQEIVDVLTAGTGTVTYQPFPPGYVAYNTELDDRYAYDPDKATKLLAAEGYDAANPLTFEITASALNEAQAQLVQAQLAKIGVNATIALVPAGSSTWQQTVYLGRTAGFALDGTVGRESPVQNLSVVYGPTGLMNKIGRAHV